MILYLHAETTVPDVTVDFIGVKLKSGETVSLNWDESTILRKSPDYYARYKGVYFDEEYANGRINELKEMEVVDLQLFSEKADKADFKITCLEFIDDDGSLLFDSGNIYEVKGCACDG